MALEKIVFASMTGNTEEIADIVADKLRDLGLDVDVDECTTVDAFCGKAFWPQAGRPSVGF